ncbi:MAG: Nif3-like dinuclear metal center hexameric protein [Prevotella sp.]
MKIIEVVSALEQFAPLSLQADFDNAGLQIGLTDAEVSGALLCLDVTEAIVDEAISKGCNLIISHHPLIFHKLRRITGEDYVQRTVMKAIKNDITILSLHTNMDTVRGGVNYKMAEKLGLEQLRFFGKRQQLNVGEDEAEAHEQLCRELEPRQTDGYAFKQSFIEAADGVVGTFAEPLAADDLVLKLRKAFDVECVMCNQLLLRPIKTVALCGGAGDFLLDDAIAEGADAFITGEMHYHQYFGHDQEIQICVIGHYQSEQYTSEIFRDVMAHRCPGVKTFISEINTNPIIYL